MLNIRYRASTPGERGSPLVSIDCSQKRRHTYHGPDPHTPVVLRRLCHSYGNGWLDRIRSRCTFGVSRMSKSLTSLEEVTGKHGSMLHPRP